MNKTQNKKTHRYLNLFIAEFRNGMSLPKIAGMVVGALLLPLLFSYIPLFIFGAKEIFVFETTLIQAGGIFIFSRVVNAVRDKATVDKNKAAFLYYDKNLIVLTKLMLEALMFIIGFTLLVAVGAASIFGRETNITASQFMDHSFAILPGYLCLHLFIYSMSKWIIAFIPKKGLAIASSMLFALVMITPIFILNQFDEATMLLHAINRGTSGSDFQKIASSWFAHNQVATAFMPYFNIGLITGVKDIQMGPITIKQIGETWYAVIPMLMMVGSIAASFVFQSSAQKRYLSAS